jgi:hypothetical protein
MLGYESMNNKEFYQFLLGHSKYVDIVGSWRFGALTVHGYCHH